PPVTPRASPDRASGCAEGEPGHAPPEKAGPKPTVGDRWRIPEGSHVDGRVHVARSIDHNSGRSQDRAVIARWIAHSHNLWRGPEHIDVGDIVEGGARREGGDYFPA